MPSGGRRVVRFFPTGEKCVAVQFTNGSSRRCVRNVLHLPRIPLRAIKIVALIRHQGAETSSKFSAVWRQKKNENVQFLQVDHPTQLQSMADKMRPEVTTKSEEKKFASGRWRTRSDNRRAEWLPTFDSIHQQSING